jgi:hypothetical protein
VVDAGVSSRKTRSRPVLGAVVVLALVAVAAYLIVSSPSVISASRAPSWRPAGGVSLAAATASLPVDAAALAAARLTYAEQVESQNNINLLAEGQIASFAVNKVDAQPDSAIVYVTANFTDGTKAPGQMRFVKSGDMWFFVTITGVRDASTYGFADVTNNAQTIATTATAEQKLAELGITDPDPGVVATIAEQQVANQPTFTALLNKQYKRFDMGAPTHGPDTYTLPVTMVRSKNATETGRVILITKNVEDRDLTFITTFERD